MQVCIACGRELPDENFYWRKDVKRLARDCIDCKKRRAISRFNDHARYERYGITKEIFDAQWERQNRRCALCRTDVSGGRGSWNIDHCHSADDRTGKWRITTSDTFRGILCHTCNVGLGQLEKFMDGVGYERCLEYLGSRVTPDG
jgi:hypothetical protein